MKIDIEHAIAGHMRGDREAGDFLRSIITTHDRDALQAIIDYLHTEDRPNVELWLRPFRSRLMVARATTVHFEVDPSSIYEPGNLAARWLRVYWGLIQRLAIK